MRKTDILTDAQIRNAKPEKGKFVKRLLDGDGLYLQVTKAKEGFNRNWIFRYEMDGVRHDYGVDPLHRVSLAEARRRRTDLRLAILDGIDPLQERVDARKERLAGQGGEGNDIQDVRRGLLQNSPQDMEQREASEAMGLDHAGLRYSRHRFVERQRHRDCSHREGTRADMGQDTGDRFESAEARRACVQLCHSGQAQDRRQSGPSRVPQGSTRQTAER